ncbi:MAG: hypothetical protein KOO66_09625 [Bacteroidales bacterium]|nr:hypothetical protein [Bacteroidales bacterium]
MKKILTLLIFTILLQTSVFSQVKFWEPEKFIAVRTKGIICKFDEPVKISSDISNKSDESAKMQKPDSIAGIIPAYTIAGVLLPYVIKYGSYAIQKATSKDEKDYTAVFTSMNSINFADSLINENGLKFSTQLKYYQKRESAIDVACNYEFKLQKEKKFYSVSLENNNMLHNSPVKVKKKYDLVLTNFDISIKALIDEIQENGNIESKIVDIGTQKIYLISPCFLDSSVKNSIVNEAKYKIPNLTNDKKKIEIKNIIISLSINYSNPYGLTSSTANHFFTENSETNEELLNSILIEKEDE